MYYSASLCIAGAFLFIYTYIICPFYIGENISFSSFFFLFGTHFCAILLLCHFTWMACVCGMCGWRGWDIQVTDSREASHRNRNNWILLGNEMRIFFLLRNEHDADCIAFLMNPMWTRWMRSLCVCVCIGLFLIIYWKIYRNAPHSAGTMSMSTVWIRKR